MGNRLFLLDGMALAYRAHFALIAKPMFSSQGLNTSALFSFTQTLIELVGKEKPTHLAAVFDTEASTERHVLFADYKQNRQRLPEDLGRALPYLDRILQAFRVPTIRVDGYEADDVIGTLARKAEAAGFEVILVSPDKDFGQLVTDRCTLYRPGYRGDPPERLGIPQVLEKWGIARVEQVVDALGLMGDATDNIPGVPGVGFKTAQRLLADYGTVENVLAHAVDLKGRLKENLDENRESALLSKRLATINRHVPVDFSETALRLREPDRAALRSLFVELEFKSLLSRYLQEPAAAAGAPPTVLEEGPGIPPVQTRRDRQPIFRLIADPAEREALGRDLANRASFAVGAFVQSDAEGADLLGLAFCWEENQAAFVPVPRSPSEATAILEPFKRALEDERLAKAGYDLKHLARALLRRGICLRGSLFDAMLVHALVDPEQRHGLGFLAETLVQYRLSAPEEALGLAADEIPALQGLDPEMLKDAAAESAEVCFRLASALRPLLTRSGQEALYKDVEAPLIPVLVAMEAEGVALDREVLSEFSARLNLLIQEQEQRIFSLVGRPFNLSSPRQLGEVLFDELRLADGAKRTRTGQYATSEQVLSTLAARHEVVRLILDHRGMVKLKNTYVEALPAAISPATGRVHTHFGQVQTATGRLQSDRPNLQNIPIRSQLGREIRKAFIARPDGFVLLSADYSQIELRIIAALSKDAAMLEAFSQGVDIHQATAARIYGVERAAVTREMRDKAKMVNFGIPYGISAFGLAQRLAIPRQEAAGLIHQYFDQFGGIRDYIDRTLTFAREHGYVETILGRRRYLRDITSRNATVRSAAERNAINMPIQGSAADMIKLAMTRIHSALCQRGLRSKLLLQVHDELLLEVAEPELGEVTSLVRESMQKALPLEVPLEIETGWGSNWLEAHP